MKMLFDRVAVYFRPLRLLAKGTFVLFLRLFWEPISRKRSHWWHWKPYEPEVDDKLAISVPGNPKEKPRTSFWSNLWQTNFGWGTAAVLEPANPQLFRIGFIDSSGRKELCSKIVTSRRVGMLIGPETTRFFALNLMGQQIALRNVMRAPKYRMPRDAQIY